MHAKIISFSAEGVCHIALLMLQNRSINVEEGRELSWTEQLNMSSSGVVRKAISV